MKKEKILKLFTEKKALLKGHFLLSSGLHSDTYLQSALVLQYPDLAGKLARQLIADCRLQIADLKINTVVSPALGGIVIGQEVARVLGCRAIFTEREKVRGNHLKMNLRRGFQIKKGEKVIVAEDVITTGGSTREVINAVKNRGGKVVAVVCLVDRRYEPITGSYRSGGQARLRLGFGGQVKFDYPLISLLKLEITNYQPQECPLCRRNIPFIKPGSRKHADFRR